MEEPMDLYEFKKMVEILAKAKSPAIFPNPTVEHAGVVLSAILDNSKEIVRVYDNVIGDITDSSPELIAATKKYIESKKKLLYIYDDFNKDSELYKLLLDYSQKPEYSAAVDIRKGSLEFHESIKEVNNEGVIFTLGDDEMCRIEYQDGFSDTKNRKAICSFRYSSMVLPLKEKFDHHFLSLPKGFLPN